MREAVEAVLLAYCICSFLGYHVYFYYFSSRMSHRGGRRFNVYGTPASYHGINYVAPHIILC